MDKIIKNMNVKHISMQQHIIQEERNSYEKEARRPQRRNAFEEYSSHASRDAADVSEQMRQ